MTEVAVANLSVKPRSQWRSVWMQFRNHRGAMVGAAIFALILIGVIAGPWLWPLGATHIDYKTRNLFMTAAHPLGTDEIGRDMLARMIAGGRISTWRRRHGHEQSPSSSAPRSACLAGFFRLFDGPLMRLTDLFLALPLLPLLLVMVMLFREALASRFGPETGIFLLIVIGIGLTSWMQTARIVRADVLAIKEREFVLAARSIGTRTHRLITRHILPNVLSPIMVSATLGIASAIITESALSFLGLGFPPDFPTWGRLLYDAVLYIDQYPSRVLWPGLAISLTVLSVNFIGDGLRDALDPRMRH